VPPPTSKLFTLVFALPAFVPLDPLARFLDTFI
jgi:hypothetical protein